MFGKFGWWAGFALRHATAAAVTVGAVCALWSATYFGLLLLAFLQRSGVGSPVAYPVGLVVFGVAGLAASLILYMPATALADWIVTASKRPFLLQAPLSVALMGLLYAIESRLIGWEPRAVGFLVALVPFTGYWLVAQFVPLMTRTLDSIYRYARSKINWGEIRFRARQRILLR